MRKRFVLAGAIAIGLGCAAQPTEILSRTLSPDGSMDVVIAVDGDEGATGGLSHGVFVVAHGAAPTLDSRVLSGMDLSSVDGKQPAGVRWMGNDRLIVAIRSGRVMFYKNACFAVTKSGERFVGIRLDAPFFGPN